MSKAIITDNDLLKEEIKALYNYVNRDEFNINVVEVMVSEIQSIVGGSKPYEDEDAGSSEQIMCPNCHSANISSFCEIINRDGIDVPLYYCEKCHKTFVL